LLEGSPVLEAEATAVWVNEKGQPMRFPAAFKAALAPWLASGQ